MKTLIGPASQATEDLMRIDEGPTIFSSWATGIAHLSSDFGRFNAAKRFAAYEDGG
ncbi:MAG: hypothetical protein J0H18_06470 [Rhizobiales bacterium]|nr:hypothetical protein [Hyphomicrobiales bacterium]